MLTFKCGVHVFLCCLVPAPDLVLLLILQGSSNTGTVKAGLNAQQTCMQRLAVICADAVGGTA